MGRKKLLALIISLFIAQMCFAKSLSIQIVQNNNAVTGDTVCAVSQWVEQAVVDFFFESGHIVTTSPVAIYSDSEENKKNLMTALKETFLGGMDFLVRIELDYNSEKDNPNLLLLDYIRTARWTSYESRTGKVISSGESRPEKITLENNNEQGITTFASIMAGNISTGLISSKVKK